MIKIEKVGTQYRVRATPPHVLEEWVSETPLAVEAIVQVLRERGAHQTDIGDAFYEADPEWTSE